MSRARVLFIISFLSLGACAAKESTSTATGGRISPTYQGPTETSYCATPTNYGGTAITVSGTAEYIRRETYNNPAAAPTFEGLGSASTSHATLPATAYPIRAAEIRVTDASGAVVQCGQTSTTGTFSITLPAGNTNYTLSINSRSAQFNGGDIYMKASVLNKPEANQFYSLSTTVNAGSGNVSGLALQATATTSGAMLGAAFNILDQIYAANAYLRSKVGTCSATFTGCTNVSLSSAVPKISAYWEKGFNPNDYFGSSSGLSFYLPDYSRLFILGGISGAIDDADTDHFDNSVILHEYGHFLEDSMFESDSPGGSHNGNKIIDPRLAWSEGWGNFIQAAILVNNGTMTSPRYFDSSGNVDGTADLFFEVDLENMSGNDVVVSGQGEGNFREFSVTRFLYDVVDGTGAETTGVAYTDDMSDDFNQLWAALTKSSGSGFRQSTLAYRNIGHMQIAQQALGGAATNWTNIRAGNYQEADNTEYAQYVTTTAGTCAVLGGTGLAYSINPTFAATGLSSSNLFVDNDFYHLKITTAGSYTIQLSYEDADGAGQEADLDLYVYNEDAVFGSAADMVGRSYNDPTATVGDVENESVTATFAAGNYLINVNAYTGGSFSNADTTHYTIRLNGVALCPDSL